MSYLNLADLIATGVAISCEEAVALTLAISDGLDVNNRTGVPGGEDIFLSSTGQVSFSDVSQSTDPDITRALAALLRRLLQLDDRASGDRRKRAPGGLLVVLARALRQIDLPPLAPPAFREAIARFGSGEPAMLAALFWRAASLRVPLPPPRPQPLVPQAAASLPFAIPVRREGIEARSEAIEDRRRAGPSRAELRRFLRETERDLFETHERVQADRRALERPAQLATAPRWHHGVSSALAILVGAAIGTLVVFILAGTGKLDPPAASRPTTARDRDLPRSGQTSQPLPTTRTVQPLLLAAAVGGDVFSPSFEPRGRALLFHAGRRSSPLMRASMTETGEVRSIETLLDDDATNYHVTMSPGGTRIAYDSDRDGVRGVYVARADGSGSRRISGAGFAAVPSWSPDGRRLAFARAEPKRPQVWNLWIADVGSGRMRRITTHRVGQPWGGSWFPDGRRIAYSVEDRLVIVDLRSGRSRSYRSPRAGNLIRTPAVSPDGRQIVFQVRRHGVWLLDIDRATMRRILDDTTAEEFVWSPDGNAIAYHARRRGSYSLWRLTLSNSGD